MYQKNVSILIYDTTAEESVVFGWFVCENSESFVQVRLRYNNLDGVAIIMLHADQLLRGISAVIDRIVAADIYIYTFWISLHMY
jgi:hypothetical protein